MSPRLLAACIGVSSRLLPACRNIAVTASTKPPWRLFKDSSRVFLCSPTTCWFPAVTLRASSSAECLPQFKLVVQNNLLPSQSHLRSFGHILNIANFSSIGSHLRDFKTFLPAANTFDYFVIHHDRLEETCTRHSLVKYLAILLASLSLSYLGFKLGVNLLDQSFFVVTASCLSNQPSPLHGQISQDLLGSNLPTSAGPNLPKSAGPNPPTSAGPNLPTYTRPNLPTSARPNLLSSAELNLPTSAQESLEISDQRKIGDGKNEFGKISLVAAIKKAQMLCRRRKDEVGTPGIVVCVSIDGKQVYAEGFGFADLENQIPMKPQSVLRIASISKAMTAVILAKAYEAGLIELDLAVQHYVPNFPQKEFMGEKVEITVRQVLSHTSGIRHYKLKDDPVLACDQPIAELLDIVKSASLLPFYKTGTLHQEKKPDTNKKVDKKNKKQKAETSEMERKEYYLKKHFQNTAQSLALFADDPLVARPGTKFLYTTFGYILLEAVVESALKITFKDAVRESLKQMGLQETCLDLNDAIIYNRVRYYVKDKMGNVVNAPYVDNSYKWAGGGLLSSAEDVVKFGNILLYSAQRREGSPDLPGYLKASTLQEFWTPQGVKGADMTYGLGFEIRPAQEHYGMCQQQKFGVGHTGAAVGASSALFILPRQYSAPTLNNSTKINNNQKNEQTSAGKHVIQTNQPDLNQSDAPKNVPDLQCGQCCCRDCKLAQSCDLPRQESLPQGVVVCIMLNMISVSVKDLAAQIASIFESVDLSL